VGVGGLVYDEAALSLFSFFLFPSRWCVGGDKSFPLPYFSPPWIVPHRDYLSSLSSFSHRFGDEGDGRFFSPLSSRGRVMEQDKAFESFFLFSPFVPGRPLDLNVFLVLFPFLFVFCGRKESLRHPSLFPNLLAAEEGTFFSPFFGWTGCEDRMEGR